MCFPRTALVALFLPALACSSASAASTLLWSDNFDVADGPFDSAGTAGRLSGSLAGSTSMQAFGAQQAITGNSLELIGSSGAPKGVRFGDQNDRFDWAAGAGATILLDGGFVVSYDWNPGSNTNAEWHSMNFGILNGDGHGVNSVNTDYGILVRNASNGTNSIEAFNISNKVSETNSFIPTPNTWHAVTHTLALSSFANGSSVNVATTIDGVEYANNSFLLTHDGSFRMDLATNTSDHLIDNFAVTTLPEPSTTWLAGLTGLGLLIRRRRR